MNLNDRPPEERDGQHDLFLPAAVKARRHDWLGGIVVARPPIFVAMTAAAMLVVTAIVCFLCLAVYTKRATVSGQLVPATGVIKVFAPQAGTVVEKLVTEGQRVTKGERLCVLSGDRRGVGGDEIFAAVSAQIALRQQSLNEEAAKLKILHVDEKHALQRKIADLELAVDKMGDLMETQRARVALSEQSVGRFRGLAAQNFISQEHLQQKQEDLLDQRNRLQSLERDALVVARELRDRKNELGALHLQQENRLAQISRSTATASQELTENEARRRIVVTAPFGGVVTAATFEAGQLVESSRPLLSILPVGTSLQAHLFAPSSAIGFIRPGNRVVLRYQAFPYQNFGHASGDVVSVSKTSIPARELEVMAATEPMYLITVNLRRQSITAYGEAIPLQPGMAVSADVLQDGRRLYEWMLEPLFSMTGKFK